MLNVTDMADTLQEAGIPVTLIEWFAPTGELSGTETLMGPEQNCTAVEVEEELVNRTAGSPRHMVTDEGVTVGAGGV